MMKGIHAEIMERYKNAGLKIINQFAFVFQAARASEFYKEHRGQPFFEGLVLAMASGPIMALCLEGEDAIALVRKLNGATNPREAEPGTIQHDFRSAGGPFNIVHASDSQEAYDREMVLMARYRP